MDQKQKEEAQRIAAHDAKRVRAFQQMVASDGWKFFQELLNSKIEEKAAKVWERPPIGVDDSKGEQWDKGAVYAWIMARDIPEVTIATFKEEHSDPATEKED